MPGFSSKAVHVGFVLDKAALEQVYRKVLLLPLSVAFQQFSLFIFSYIRGMYDGIQ